MKLAKKPFIFPKKGFLIGFLLFLGIGFGIYALFPDTKSQEDQLTDLITRIEGGEELPSGELKDYCHLMAILRDSISPPCVCILDGINWDNPPKSPERLPDVWEFVENDPNNGHRPRYRHKTYTRIIIGFDLYDTNGDEKPHWHRENPNTRKGQEYLDKDCQVMYRKSKKSHIYTRK